MAEGGLVDPSVDSLEVSCTPGNIPVEFVVDVTEMQPHDVIRLSDIPMPKGVTALGDPDMPVVTVLITAAAEAAADEPEATEEPGEDAAPAAE
jgi:large subunit ribosomal protein L25